MDVVGGFVLADGRRAKALTGIDDHSRFCVSAHLMLRESSPNVCDGLAAALRAHGVPGQILTDNGKVFTGRFNQPPVEVLFDRICRENGIEHLHTQPRSPTTTGKVERFHRALRTEFRTDRVFVDLATAQAELDEWVHDYNHDRPHQALDMATPASRFLSARHRTRDPDQTHHQGRSTCRGPPRRHLGHAPRQRRRSGVCQLATGLPRCRRRGKAHRRVGHRQGPAVLRRRPAPAYPETRERRGGESQAIHSATTAFYSDNECHRSTELDLSPITRRSSRLGERSHRRLGRTTPMTLLAALLPGVREFRVPFTVGVIWMLTLATLAISYPSYVEGDSTQRLWLAFTRLPTTVQLALGSGAAYAIGLVATRLQKDVSSRLGTLLRRVLGQESTFEQQKLTRREWLQLFWLRLYPDYFGTKALEDRILARNFQADDEFLCSGFVAKSIFEEEAPLAQLEFSARKPDQYQAYDRILAEAEFKKTIAIPTFALLCTIAIVAANTIWTGALISLAFGLALFLATQGHRQNGEAYRHLLTAMTLGWTIVPALDSLRARLSLLDSDDRIRRDRISSEKALITIETMFLSLPYRELKRYGLKLVNPTSTGIVKKWPDDHQRRYVDFVHRQGLYSHIATVGLATPSKLEPEGSNRQKPPAQP